MARVTGLGGAFLRADDPKALYDWYGKHLGIASPDGCFSFPREVQRAYIAVAFFPKSSEYFPVSQPAMLISTLFCPRKFGFRFELAEQRPATIIL